MSFHRTLHPLQDVGSAMRWSRSTVYQKIKEGLFVRPVKMGSRASAWPSDEVAALQDAYVAGKDEDAIRQLVQTLMAARNRQS
jgi:prophage regulatory protein